MRAPQLIPIQILSCTYGSGATTRQAPARLLTHTYTVENDYIVKLTVTDPSGQDSVATTPAPGVSVLGTNCEVFSVSFRNGGANTPNDFLLVRSATSNPKKDRLKPVTPAFSFTATTSSKCAAVRIVLRAQTGDFSVTLTTSSLLNGLRTFTGNGISEHPYNTGRQVYDAFGLVGGVTAHDLQSEFSVTS